MINRTDLDGSCSFDPDPVLLHLERVRHILLKVDGKSDLEYLEEIEDQEDIIDLETFDQP